MSGKVYRVKPVLKVGETATSAYVSFDEDLGIPGLEHARVSLEFDDSSFENIKSIVDYLKRKGLQFVIQI